MVLTAQAGQLGPGLDVGLSFIREALPDLPDLLPQTPSTAAAMAFQGGLPLRGLSWIPDMLQAAYFGGVKPALLHSTALFSVTRYSNRSPAEQSASEVKTTVSLLGSPEERSSVAIANLEERVLAWWCCLVNDGAIEELVRRAVEIEHVEAMAAAAKRYLLDEELS